jgi:hypothetical protein
MDADYDTHEIVKVIPDFWLFDAESYQRSYITNHGNPLLPGYYVVTWPEDIRVKRFNGHAAFHGPFESRLEAQAFLNTMKKYRYQLIPLSNKWTLTAPKTNQQVEKKVA